MYNTMKFQESQIKIKSQLLRLGLNISIMLSVFGNPELMQHICGPFTFSIANKHHLLPYIIIVEIIRLFYRFALVFISKLSIFQWVPSGLNRLISIKYLLILILKTFLVLQEQHRKKFYLHSLLIEVSILVIAILLDCIQKYNIKQAGELLLIENLHRLSLVYVLTQTFCPNLLLHYAVHSLLVFLLAQVQSQEKFGLKRSLYVKHDIYRFMVMTSIFFALGSIAQLSANNWKPLLAFSSSIYLLYTAIKSYGESDFKLAARNLFLVGGILAITEIAFLFLPFTLWEE